MLDREPPSMLYFAVADKGSVHTQYEFINLKNPASESIKGGRPP